MLKTFCRICLTATGVEYSIDEAIDGTKSLYTVVCRLCPEAFPDKSSEWSRHVCEHCRKRILNAQELYELCLKSAELLEKQEFKDYKENDSCGMAPLNQVGNPTFEQEDEIDSDFFAPSEDSISETQNQPYLDVPSNESRTVPLSLEVIDTDNESFASIDSDWLLNTEEQRNITGIQQPDASSIIKMNEPTDTIVVAIHATGVIEAGGSSGTADVNRQPSANADLSSEESEDETAKIFTAKVYHCEKCQRAFFEKITYKKHLKYHEMKRNNCCTLCEKGFASKSLLSEHLEKHDNSLLCIICGEMSDTPKRNKRHYENHMRVRNYACPKCPMRFYTSLTLSSHLKAHSGSRLFCCDVCGQRLSSKKNLINHKTAKHSDVRPFSCDICGLRFVIKDSIKKHMITHTGERPHGCMFCDRRYGSVGDLKDHLRKHIGDKIYQCDRCDAAFRLIAELRDHYAVHFKDGIDPATSYPPNFRLTLSNVVNLRYQKELSGSSADKSQ
ncbi:zinc finger and BTB domain-containing protein 17-like [Anopheles darlingi]|uniref:zinc finger and BTB domain-containing protein 17-like n=1 Tax=Anopheles darlingi TaxID=43151 RepID=UPI00210029C3|nr:zinc finger and BTB domain-containing protein 17-like [Anopheles darlingi]